MVMTTNHARIQGIVLAGVHAWGESLLEQICCRPLLPVLGRPLVWYVLDWLARNGVAQVSICANSDTCVFRECLETVRPDGVDLSYYADLMPRGPAGCMRDAAAAGLAETFVVVDGTVVTRLNMDELLAAHHGNGAAITVVVSQKPGSAAVEPTGVYVVSRSALEHVPARGYQDIKEVLIPRLYECGQRVVPFAVEAGRVLRVTNAASYLSVSGWVLQDPPGLPGRYNRIGRAMVHVSSFLARSARLIGPVVIGPDCVIEQDATVLGPTVIAPDSTVGRNTVISRACVWPRCRVGPGAYVEHSILTTCSRIQKEQVVRDTVCMADDVEHMKLSPADLYWTIAGTRREKSSDDRSLPSFEALTPQT
jgi:mannose-1-phosphate guanylyltransferase